MGLLIGGEGNCHRMGELETPTAVFYDTSIRAPPETWEQHLSCEHVEVRFSNTESSMMALPSLDIKESNTPVVTVPNFSSVPHMIKGTNRIATILEVMKLGLMSELDMAQLPIAAEPIDFFLVWHQREHDDPAHRWLRDRIIETTRSMGAQLESVAFNCIHWPILTNTAN
jgi:DNA-binding transcriptional LysR family regulator